MWIGGRRKSAAVHLHKLPRMSLCIDNDPRNDGQAHRTRLRRYSEPIALIARSMSNERLNHIRQAIERVSWFSTVSPGSTSDYIAVPAALVRVRGIKAGSDLAHGLVAHGGLPRF